jgi:hypothetical protein
VQLEEEKKCLRLSRRVSYSGVVIFNHKHFPLVIIITWALCIIIDSCAIIMSNF